MWPYRTNVPHSAGTTALCVIGVILARTLYSTTAALRPPHNLTVLRVGGGEATFSWLVHTDEGESVLYYELTYEPSDFPGGVFRVVRGVRPELRELQVGCLQPHSMYTAYMVTVDTDLVRSNVSNEVFFTTTSDEVNPVLPASYAPHAGEILIVVVIVGAWIVAVMVFLRRWASIRILQPMEPRYRHNPKNLENVKIVKRPQDSVIYKNYGRKLSVTIVEREKRRLQRMHTIATLPTIEMERVVTEM